MAKLDRVGTRPQIVLLILVFISLGLGFSLQLPIFKITQVETRLVNSGCIDSNVIKNKINWQGKNIFTGSFNVKDILKQYPCVKTIKIDRIFPNKIILSVEERQSVIVLQTPEIVGPVTLDQSLLIASSSATPSGQFLAVDHKGIVFKKVDQLTDQIRVIFLDQKFTVGQTVPESLISNILKMRDKLKDFQITVNTLWIFSKVLVLNAPPFIILDFDEQSFPTDKNFDAQLTALQLILQKAKIDNKELRIIDLRFENPVIKYAIKEK